MKQMMKTLLLTLSLLLILGASILPVFAEEAASDEVVAEKIEEFPVEDAIVENGEVIQVLEDGTKYNSTTKEWILEEKEGIAFGTDFSRMLSSLQYMWKGMLCIFIVIGAIILATVAMNSIFSKLAEKKQDKENNA